MAVKIEKQLIKVIAIPGKNDVLAAVARCKSVKRIILSCCRYREDPKTSGKKIKRGRRGLKIVYSKEEEEK